MRVLHIVSSIAQTNGATNVVMNYYRKLYADNIVFDFLYFQPAQVDFSDEINSLGGKTVYCGANNKVAVICNIRKTLSNIIENYDAVENHELYLTRFIKGIVSGKTHLILHSHTVKYSQRKFAEFRNIVLCHGLEKYGDYFVSCSQKSAEVFWKEKIEADNFTIMANAISKEKCLFSEEVRFLMRKKLNIDDDVIVLGCIARFDDGKNQNYLVEIIKRLDMSAKNYKLILVGDGKNYKAVSDMVNEYCLNDKVIMPGRIENIHINDFLCCMDIFLFPSSNEGLGLALIEAQCNGLTCIASTGIPDEARISDYYFTIPLYSDKGEANYSEWIECINKMDGQRHFIDFDNSGFDIDYEAIRVAGWYKSILN